MPLYDYGCDRGHVTESRQGMDIAFIPCRCGLRAMRVQVYRDQYMQAETGPKGGLKNRVPKDEKPWGKRYREFREASDEIHYAAERAEVQPPPLYKEAKRAARKRMKV